MNLFQKYGIKEVADVVFYSISKIGDEEFYTPVLFLDTLKVSTLEKSASKTNATGGYTNKKLISWNFGKEITLNLEDALFTPASMSMIWGGDLQAKLSPYISVIVKLNTANKYGRLHYSTKAYPSPALTNEEWEIVFKAAQEQKVGFSSDKKYWDFSGLADSAEKDRFWKEYYLKDDEIIEQNRTELRKRYQKRNWYHDYKNALSNNTVANGLGKAGSDELDSILQNQTAMPQALINTVVSYVTELKRLGNIDTNFHDIEVIDRMEKCVVRNRDGLTISTAEQKKNLLRYYQDDRSSSYVIYYDAKTMLPLLSISDEGLIKGWDSDTANSTDKLGNVLSAFDRDFDGQADNDKFKIKVGTVYYKWTRTVKRKTGTDDGILGRTLVIDAETFPDTYKIVGETWIREQKTGKDQRYQFTIHRAQVSSDTNITLQADGDPTTFSMSVEVLTPPNGIMIELKQFDVDEDYVHGGTRIVPQKNNYTYTPTTIDLVDNVGFTNDEIY